MQSIVFFPSLFFCFLSQLENCFYSKSQLPVRYPVINIHSSLEIPVFEGRSQLHN